MESTVNKTALITGAARRIGASLAKGLAENGYDIVLHFGKSEQEAQLVAENVEQLGRKCYLIQQDLVEPDAVESVFAMIRNLGVTVNTMIHNASIFEAVDFEHMTNETWQAAIQVNLSIPVLMNQRFLKQLDSESGNILHLLDWRALRPGVDHFPYTISKAALASVTKSLAVSLAPQVRVNGIAFGAILPPADGGDTSKLLKQVPLKRWAELDEVLSTVLFLLDGPSYITGEIIHLDGGRHLV
jgi:pteridine reductase